jgi:hypothetical protein
MPAAQEILNCWDSVKEVFGSTSGTPRTTEWIDLLRVVAAGDKGLPLETLRNQRNSGHVRRRVNRWIRAGLVDEWHDLKGPRNPVSKQFPLVIRATPKAPHLLRLKP